jgi:hypothetical protein
VNFAQGLKTLKPEPAAVEAPRLITRATAEPPSRVGKVAISVYFEPEVRKQLAIMAAHHDKSQAALMAEALNLLFEKYGESPIARA